MIEPRGAAKVQALLDRGVSIPNPYAVDIADDVDPDRISGDGVVLHQGTRLSGGKTVISAGCVLGAEGPVTVANCRLGPRVELKGGYAANAVFLDTSSMGLGHHVREGCLLEEESGGAHCVGLKQTILFPFVTLGSLINFCDVLMAGGRSRKEHSEVGSSYIHFNFTPSGDKTTPSLFGDVPRGVMLDQAPIFLGGQGGTVGPVQVAYGTVVGAGSILRSDVPKPDQLIVVGPPPTMQAPFVADDYRGLNRLVGKNLLYVAHLVALQSWYEHIRRPFFERQEFGALVYEGALEMLAVARAERLSRLRAMIAKVRPDDAERASLKDSIDALCAIFDPAIFDPANTMTTAGEAPQDLLSAMTQAAASGAGYVEAVRALPPEVASRGTSWLHAAVENLFAQSGTIVPALKRLPRI
ncbi:MAG: UDP-N-acetylglucosamine pyrophosphorylase [Austwickia sp.]|nr:UDP-N-acetylglucosamine pyrophosphorylase [Austwickia sp.]